MAGSAESKINAAVDNAIMPYADRFHAMWRAAGPVITAMVSDAVDAALKVEREASALREQKAVVEALERAATLIGDRGRAHTFGDVWDFVAFIEETADEIRKLKPNQPPETSPSSQRGKG